MDKVAIPGAFAQFDEHWRPRIVGEVNGSKVQISKFAGEFVWHSHPESDDFFYVVRGRVEIDFHDRDPVVLDEGDLLIIPAGVEHRPRATDEAWILNIALAGTVNTGDNADPGEYRAAEQRL
jgi:mannose-6-phosphate isomerase-like protein (cupin superfamily)